MGENYVLWYKSNKFFLLWIWFLLKKEEMLMKYLFYNEGNLEGVKIEVWGIVFSLNKIVIVFNLFLLSV